MICDDHDDPTHGGPGECGCYRCAPAAPVGGPTSDAPDREQRLEEIRSLPVAGRWVTMSRGYGYFVEMEVEDRDWLLAELARVEQERDRLRELALAVVDIEGCCTGKILDAMDRLRATLAPTP